MHATHEGSLDVPGLPIDARKVFVPELAGKSLLSVSQLCAVGCEVTFDADIVDVQYEGQSVIQGQHNERTGLYQINLPTNEAHSANTATSNEQRISTAAEIVKFLHATFGYPVYKTFYRAVATGLIHGIPGLTNWCHQAYTDATPPSVPYERTKTTSLLRCVAPTPNFQCFCGMNSSGKRTSL